MTGLPVTPRHALPGLLLAALAAVTAVLSADRPGGARPEPADGRPELVLARPGAPPADQDCCGAVSGDGQWLATGTRGGEVRVWEAAGGRLHLRLRLPAAVSALAFHPARPVVLVAGWDATVRLLDFSAGGALVGRVVGAPAGPVLAAAFSPDGLALTTGHADRVALWRIDGDRITAVREEATDGHPVQAVGFSPDGRSVAAGVVGDDAARVWRLDRPGEPPAAVAGPCSQIRGLGFTPDGQALVLVGMSGLVTAVDLVDGRRAAGELSVGSCRQAALTADGRGALVIQYDGAAGLVALPDLTPFR